MKVNLTDADLSEIREKIKPYLTPARYRHTLAVEKEAESLGKIYLPDEINRLRAAALFHDITKKLDLHEHLKICGEFGIIYGRCPEREKKLFHAKTAAAILARDFEGFCDDGIISAVRWHTTGRAGMTLFEALIYLADYIEETRSFEDCVKLREYFYTMTAEAKLSAQEILMKTLVLSFDMTVRSLLGEGSLIDADTVAARNYLILEGRLSDN